MATDTAQALTWREIDVDVKAGNSSVYDWCWVCGVKPGPDRLHVMIDNGHHTRHTYACRKHRYVEVATVGHLAGTTYVTDTRTDYEIESLAHAFRAGELKPGWE